ncbi:restriction endonuclease subunit S [Azospirillum thiophilum]|uniref:restriction endonuclease subunit S n=1 Tax=Azospirillum thiophilum TaxID=528244 RepID=UPI000AAC2B0B|nr:restriction endonuclease subunit S [Azospirillum thiophilum]
MKVPEGWTVQPLGDFLQESRIPGNDGRSARKLTVRLYGKGVVAKEIGGQGSENTKYYIRKKGQFIYSKLDFLNGAFGVVPEELDGWETTLDLPAFDVSSMIDKRWLLAYVTREQFYAAHKGLARGGRKARRVPPEDLFQIEVAVPPLQEQCRIAEVLSTVDETIKTTLAVIEQNRTVKQGVLDRLLTKGIGHDRFKQTEFGLIPEGWEVVPLRTVAHVQTGVAKGKKDIQDPVELPYLRVANVQDGRIDLTELKTIMVSASQVERYSLRSGDVLMTEGGDFDKLGRGDVWNGQVPVCLHQNHVFAVRPNPDLLVSEFLAALTASAHGKGYFLGCAKQTTNLAGIR